MKKTIVTLAMGITCLTVFFAQAQNGKPAEQPKKWGLECNVLWPFVPGVEIYTFKATYTLWTKNQMHGDFTFGILARPGTLNDDNAEKFSEIGMNTGYRQYFWKGLHAELAVYPSLAKETRNKKDGENYQGFALTMECYAGYQFSFSKEKSVSWYVMPQAGIGYNAISNLGPATRENAPFPTLNVQVGINF